MKLESMRLKLDGIRLEHDAENVERFLNYLEGVHEVSVDVLSGFLYATYDAHEVSVSDVEDSLRFLGYAPHEQFEHA